jgi:uncharacterized membrane protein
MNVEGFEGEAVKGMEKSIETFRRMVIKVHDDINRIDCKNILVNHDFKILISQIIRHYQ